MDDIYPNESSLLFERDNIFVLNIIKLVKEFQPEFQEFILHYLSSSYSIIHKQEFIHQQRINENFQIQKINDQLFQKILTLKEWCRLKIKDICPQKQINQLNLPKSLIEFCSFDLLNSNYAFNSIKKVNQNRRFPFLSISLFFRSSHSKEIFDQNIEIFHQ
jgi:hypothetical protein